MSGPYGWHSSAKGDPAGVPEQSGVQSNINAQHGYAPPTHGFPAQNTPPFEAYPPGQLYQTDPALYSQGYAVLQQPASQYLSLDALRMHNVQSEPFQKGKGKRWKGKGKKGEGKAPKGKAREGPECNHSAHRWKVVTTLEMVPCVVTKRHVPDSRVIMSAEPDLPAVIVLKTATHNVSGVPLANRLYLRPDTQASKEHLDTFRCGLKQGDKVLCNVEILSTGRCKPLPESITYPDSACTIMTPEVREHLDTILQKSKQDFPLPEEVAEREIPDLSEESVEVMLKRLRVIEARGASRRHQMMNVCNLYAQLAKLVLMWQMANVGEPLPARFHAALMNNFLQLPTVWLSHDHTAEPATPEAFSEASRVYDAVAGLRKTLDPHLAPQDIASLHGMYRWLAYGSRDHISEDLQARIIEQLEFHQAACEAPEEGDMMTGDEEDMGMVEEEVVQHQQHQHQHQPQHHHHQQHQHYPQQHQQHPQPQFHLQPLAGTQPHHQHHHTFVPQSVHPQQHVPRDYDYIQPGAGAGTTGPYQQGVAEPQRYMPSQRYSSSHRGKGTGAAGGAQKKGGKGGHGPQAYHPYRPN